nr:hypothetical protein 28 [Burkholderiaceae bacterium]
MSMLEAYRAFQAAQAAKGIDPSSAARLTQQEQADYREEQGLTPITPIVSATNNTGIITQAQNNPPPAQNNPPPRQAAPEPEPVQPIISEPSSYTGTITDTLRSASSDYANKNQDLQPGAEMYKGDGATSTGRKTMAAKAQASPAQTFSNETYQSLLDDFYKVEANPDSNPADVYNALYRAAEYVAPFENGSPSPDEWIRTMSGTPEILDDYRAFVESGGTTDRSMPTNPKQDALDLESEPTQSDADRYNELKADYDRVVAELDDVNTRLFGLESTSVQPANTRTSTRARGGLIDIARGDGSMVRVDDNRSVTIGGQVYGPDGAVYPSVTDAIQAGVFNFTYFPISTGIRQSNTSLGATGPKTVRAGASTNTSSGLQNLMQTQS